MRRRPVWIRWHDAAHVGAGEWLSSLDDTAVIVHSVGVLIAKTKQHLVIAHSCDDAGNVTGVFSIPRSAVEDWGELSH